MEDGEKHSHAEDQAVQDVEGDVQEPEPPPEPLEPLLVVPAPRVFAQKPDSARVEWQQASMTIPVSDDPRQLEVQQRYSYSVPHELQMQEVAITGPPDAVLEEAASKVIEDDWRTVLEAPCCNAEVGGVTQHVGR